MEEESFDPHEFRKQKQRDRDADEDLLKNGLISREEMQRRNSLVTGFDMANARIISWKSPVVWEKGLPPGVR